MSDNPDWFYSLKKHGDDPQRRVVCAANLYSFKPESGIAPLIVTGARHYDKLMHAQIRSFDKNIWYNKIGEEQGFVDQLGVFMTREEAHIVAINAKQIISRCGNDIDKLWSENLY